MTIEKTEQKARIEALILELGGYTSVSRICHRSRSTVSCWTKRGDIPKGFFMFLKEKYPHLKAWKAFESDALQNNKDS